jgi:hypothetical protein
VPPRNQQQEYVLTSTKADPLASLGMTGVDVLLPAGVWKIPAVDAATWLKVLLVEDLDLEAIFPGLCGPQAVFDCNQLLLTGELSEQEVADAVCDVIEVVSGRQWWVTLRLCHMFREHWELIGGALAAHGVSPWGVPLGWWIDAAYYVVVDRLSQADPQKAADFTHSLVIPPVTVIRERQDEVSEGNAFLASMRIAGAM